MQTKEDVIRAVLRIFRRFGYEGTTMSRLERGTGLRRSSLYYHFPGGKDDMADQALAAVERFLEKEVLTPLRANAPPAERLARVARTLKSYYQDGQISCLLGAFVLEDARDKFGDRIARAMTDWIAAMAATYSDAGLAAEAAAARAAQAVADIQGGLTLCAALRQTWPLDEALARMQQPLLPATDRVAKKI